MMRSLCLRVRKFCALQTQRCVLRALAIVVVIQSGESLAQWPGITLTKVGSPIWRPTDFQMFTAPANPFPATFNQTVDMFLPLEGPGVTFVPHAPPYDTELSTNAAAAGFNYQTVFNRDAIAFNPDAVWLAMTWLPDPGVIGSSRDFASGPVIPNSLFPFTTHSEMWLNGVKVETLQDGTVNPRAGDEGFTGASHRIPSQAVWHPWADDPNAGPLGHHEIRWSLRDNQGNGWNILAEFQVVPEPSTLGMVAGLVGVLAVVGRRNKDRQTSNRISR
jgi:hypothetical protein